MSRQKVTLNFFSIALHAQVAVVTKAKLDEVSVKGDCKCDGEDDTVFLNQQFLFNSYASGGSPRRTLTVKSILSETILPD